MNIVHMLSGGDVGGAKTHVLTLLQGLNKTQNIKLICFKKGDFSAEAEALGIATEVVETGNVFAAARSVQEIVKTVNADVVHCHGARANLIRTILRCLWITISACQILWGTC